MAQYLISFPSGAMDQIPDAEMPEVARGAREVCQEAIDAGVYVLAGGLAEQPASIVAADGRVTDGLDPDAISGITIVDVPSLEEALAWAAKVAAACRCAQEVRELGFDAELDAMLREAQTRRRRTGRPRASNAASRASDRARIATTPDPPYTAVVFTSLRTDGDRGYGAMAARMEALAAEQSGYLGIESAHEGLGLTVSYWTDDAAAAAWKQVAEHLVAQQHGRDAWYTDYQVRVATVTRSYGPDAPR